MEECEAKGNKCGKCKKYNHWSSQCFTKPENVRAVECQEFEDQDDCYHPDDLLFKVDNISTVHSQSKRLFTSLTFMDSTIKFTELECQLDTGVTCNLMCYRDLCKINQSPNPPLKNSVVKLRLFDGSIMKPMGCVSITVTRENRESQLDFQIVENKSKPIIKIRADNVCRNLRKTCAVAI